MNTTGRLGETRAEQRDAAGTRRDLFFVVRPAGTCDYCTGRCAASAGR